MRLLGVILCLSLSTVVYSLRIPTRMMALQHSAIVPEIDKKVRLDIFLTKAFPAYTRTFFAGLCEKGSITVNDKVKTSKHYNVNAGDSVSFKVEDSLLRDIAPENIDLDIIYEDDSIIAINKPSGMVVHPAVGSPNGTFVNALLYYLGPSASKLYVDDKVGTVVSREDIINQDNIMAEVLEREPAPLDESSLRPGVIHRLDKGTSGVLLGAKTGQGQAKMSSLFRDRQIRKVYLTVCIGHPGDTTIIRPLGRSEKNRQHICVVEGPAGKVAVSHVRTLCFDGKLSVCLVRIETGR